jgi:hypothetical protein
MSRDGWILRFKVLGRNLFFGNYQSQSSACGLAGKTPCNFTLEKVIHHRAILISLK